MEGGERRKKLCSSYFPSQHSALFLLWKVLHVPAAPKWISLAAKVKRASERDCWLLFLLMHYVFGQTEIYACVGRWLGEMAFQTEFFSCYRSRCVYLIEFGAAAFYTTPHKFLMLSSTEYYPREY